MKTWRRKEDDYGSDYELCKTRTAGVGRGALFVGVGMKKTETIADKYIPVSLGGLGILLCGIWVVATCPLSGMQEIAMAVFTAIVQGILVAGLSTYVNQVIKQHNKEE